MSHAPGETIATRPLNNRFHLREVQTRFPGQTAVFVHDAMLPADEFHGPFFSAAQAIDHLRKNGELK